MRLNPDCIPCLQRQALQAIRFAAGEEAHERLLRRTIMRLGDLEWGCPPPEVARQIQSFLRVQTGNPDPYSRVKQTSNREALGLYPRMKEIVESSADRLRTAARIAIAGNIIDFGSFLDADLEATIDRSLHSRFAVDDTDKFGPEIAESSSLLYFLDNAGEIVLDRLFLEAIQTASGMAELHLVVKGGPMLNDATLEDAQTAGLKGLPGVSILTVSNGDPGTGPPVSSKEVKSWIDCHDMVISKGQANYEEIGDHSGIYFLLVAKCAVVARHLGVDVGDLVFYRSG